MLSRWLEIPAVQIGIINILILGIVVLGFYAYRNHRDDAEATANRVEQIDTMLSEFQLRLTDIDRRKEFEGRLYRRRQARGDTSFSFSDARAEVDRFLGLLEDPESRERLRGQLERKLEQRAARAVAPPAPPQLLDEILRDLSNAALAPR